MWRSIVLVFFVSTFVATQNNDIPEYIKPCRRSDPQLETCFIGALTHLKPYLARGIPEIQMPSVEPFIMDQLSLQLTGGPQGYRVILKNMEVFGASNFTVKTMKLADGSKPFEARITMPKLDITAKYSSSGVLLIIPASGSGDFSGHLEGVTCDIKGKVSTNEKPTGTHLHVDSLDINLKLKKVKLGISHVFNNNQILQQATNLFLQENGHEVFKAMQPQLQKKLSSEFSKIANQLLLHVPREKFYLNE